MNTQTDPLATDRQFFAALISADTKALDQILADDFIIIDVMAGSETAKTDFVAAVAAKMVKFISIEPSENRVRIYGDTAVVNGRTRMVGKFGDADFTLGSRYTHVYVQQQGHWRMVGAQGTQIPPAPPA